MTVDDVLEVLAQTCIERLQVYFALNDFEQSVELVDGQVFNYSLGHRCDFLLIGVLRQSLVDEVRVDLLERGVTSVDQVPQVLDRRRFVLDQDQDEMQR